MRQNLGPKTYSYPMPVYIIGTYDNNEKPNAMNAAWGGIYDTNKIFLCLSSDHKTSQSIKEKNEFTVSFATHEFMKECDYFGVESGNNVDKIKKANFHPVKSEFVDAPYFEELPLSLDCKVTSIKEENETLYIIADIVNVSASSEILEDGKIDSMSLNFISYDPANHNYFILGKPVGKAFKEGLKIK